MCALSGCCGIQRGHRLPDVCLDALAELPTAPSPSPSPSSPFPSSTAACVCALLPDVDDTAYARRWGASLVVDLHDKHPERVHLPSTPSRSQLL